MVQFHGGRVNLGQFKEWTKDLPDDAEIILNEGDIVEFYEATTGHILVPALEMPYAVILFMGQPVTLDQYLDERLDVHLGNY